MNAQHLLVRFGALPQRVRVAAFVLFCSAAAAAIAFSAIGHRATTALFSTPLDALQMSEVERQLASWNVPFTPVTGNVVVDTGRRSDVLLRLSLAGLPHQHLTTTQESLSGIGVLTPQSVVDAQTRAGLSGDIATALRTVAGVEDAHVIVAPAKAAEFADERSAPSTASVRLSLHPGARLAPEAANGIRAFVAASVEGLDAAHVTVLDDNGLAVGDAPQRANGDDLQHSLQSALDSVFGAGAALARVHVDCDPRESERRDLTRSPFGSSVASESAGESYVAAGKRYEKTARRDDRGVDARETVTHIPSGSVVRITAAVFVDAARRLDLAAVRQLAAATIGADGRRGDVLTVDAVDFARAKEPPQSVWWMLYGLIVPSLPVVLTVAGALAALRHVLPAAVSLFAPLFERARIRRQTETIVQYAPARVRGALAQEPPHAAAAIISALPAATAAAVLELYPPEERNAIVTRMQRPQSPFVPDAEEFLRTHA